MSTESEIIIFEKNIPTVEEFVHSAANSGVTLQFPDDFDFKKSSVDFVNIEIDGEKTFFAYSISTMTESDFAPGKEGVPFESEDEGRVNELPKKARKYGDMIVEFSTKGNLAGQAVYFIQKILAKHSGAAGFFDGEFITPRVLAKDEVPTAETPPELAATMVGTPRQRAAAIDKYIEKIQSERLLLSLDQSIQKPRFNLVNWLIQWFKERKLEIAIFLIVLPALFIWGFLNAKHN